MRTDEQVKIAGAGISGLACAIKLAKAGVKVEVHERKSQAGGRFWGDLQGLENWTSKQDVIDEIASYDLGINIPYHPLPPLVLIDGQGMEMACSQNRPLCYLVKRGTDPDTLDQALFNAAREAGVKVRFSSHLNPKEAKVVATGPRSREVFAIDTGLKFKTDHPNIALALVNDRAAFKGYAYLLVVDGYGCICTVMFDRFKQINQHFDRAFSIIKNHLSLGIREPKKVGGVGSFAMDFCFQKQDRYLVGESAGLQDLLWGFGIRSALSSGVLAANCIIDKKDYQKEAYAMYHQQLQASVVIRYLFEKFSTLKGGYGLMGKIVNRKADPISFLRRAYSMTPIHRIILPLALRRMRCRYPALQF